MGQQPNSDAIEPELFRQNLILTHWVEDQQSYYARAARREKKKLHRQEKISKILYCTGLGLAIIMLIFHKEYLSIALLQHIVIVSIVMSIATAAVFQGHAEKEAYAEHLRQYARMRELFARAKRKLAFFIDKKDVVSAKHIISDLGKEALAENGDWVLLHRARPIEVPKG